MISSGLAKLGYTRVNVDEGWLKGRNAQGVMYEDLDKFPSGMKGLGDWIKAQAIPGGGFMQYGLYSCRGTLVLSSAPGLTANQQPNALHPHPRLTLFLGANAGASVAQAPTARPAATATRQRTWTTWWQQAPTI